MTDQNKAQEHSGRHSRGADAAATRWAEIHPEDDVQHWPPSHVPESDYLLRNHPSASAEAAALRWFEQHADEDF